MVYTKTNNRLSVHPADTEQHKNPIEIIMTAGANMDILKEYSTDLALHSTNTVRLMIDSFKKMIKIDAAEPETLGPTLSTMQLESKQFSQSV